MVKNIGIIGYSEGNGHPFSFSAIINGFDATAFADIDWPVILQYLQRRKLDEFGVEGLKVSHVWMPEQDMAQGLAKACYVDTVCKQPFDMLNEVDGVIIARDDAESHFALAKPFLEAGKKVFVDKPLTLNKKELEYFLPFVQSSQLMTSAGYRYAIELEPLRQGLSDFGAIHAVNLVTPLDWERYGIHMLDALFSFTTARPVSIRHISANHSVFVLEMSDSSVVTIHCQGEGVTPYFNVSVFGTHKNLHVKLQDNFSAFRVLLNQFAVMLHENVQPIPVKDVEFSIKTILAGIEAEQSRSVIHI